MNNLLVLLHSTARYPGVHTQRASKVQPSGKISGNIVLSANRLQTAFHRACLFIGTVLSFCIASRDGFQALGCAMVF
jgi:hypothetical protein